MPWAHKIHNTIYFSRAHKVGLFKQNCLQIWASSSSSHPQSSHNKQKVLGATGQEEVTYSNLICRSTKCSINERPSIQLAAGDPSPQQEHSSWGPYTPCLCLDTAWRRGTHTHTHTIKLISITIGIPLLATKQALLSGLAKVLLNLFQFCCELRNPDGMEVISILLKMLLWRGISVEKTTRLQGPKIWTPFWNTNAAI